PSALAGLGRRPQFGGDVDDSRLRGAHPLPQPLVELDLVAPGTAAELARVHRGGRAAAALLGQLRGDDAADGVGMLGQVERCDGTVDVPVGESQRAVAKRWYQLPCRLDTHGLTVEQA